MNGNSLLFLISIWALPVLIAVTLHEATHGLAARLFGDNIAYLLGRVSLNPLKHVDPFGTVLLPGLLLLSHSPFLSGYARPVPVNFRALTYPRLGMAVVAAARPLMNFCLAFIAALAFQHHQCRVGRLQSVSDPAPGRRTDRSRTAAYVHGPAARAA
jgi:Zn-dependent protease